jgi:hypothetical protein
LQVSFPTDADGFLSQECPSCEQIFKVLFGQGSDQRISYCPYCGHKGQQCWYTKEQLNYIQSLAVSTVLGPELKNLERNINRTAHGILKLGMKVSIPEPAKAPMETDDELSILRFSCCDETIKAVRGERLFCIICGREADVTLSDCKKIFLSHKGVDKEVVLDFKKTLEILGYAPWLDEDAMPAGTSLERGLFKGMQDSCGVVFFLTPSFKDEGYLETEINYAIQQKRTKADKFAIIALQFVGENGVVGAIPDLLKTYVWKKPKTSLEALREIVRALPVAPGNIDWRSEISGVVTAPKIKSTSTELSAEAKAILKAAAAGDGRIMHLSSLGGMDIHAGGKSMIPDRDARTIARWEGGLEDLQRRRYIKDVGHKREIFEVTREGYEAADEMPAV